MTKPPRERKQAHTHTQNRSKTQASLETDVHEHLIVALEVNALPFDVARSGQHVLCSVNSPTCRHEARKTSVTRRDAFKSPRFSGANARTRHTEAVGAILADLKVLQKKEDRAATYHSC